MDNLTQLTIEEIHGALVRREASAEEIARAHIDRIRKEDPNVRSGVRASMSIAGIPPFNGFFSKLLIIFACIQKGHLGYALAAVIGSILTLASFMKVQKFAFLGQLKEKYGSIKEVPNTMKFAMLGLALICIVGGVLLLPHLKPFLNDAVEVILRGRDYSAGVFEEALK